MGDKTFILQIIVDGIFVVNIVAGDIEEIKAAIHKYEYERDEMISGRCGDE